ncbi:MAG TPA: cupin domain-containing protein [Chitinophagales bacterium]|nr:cupin domain-containing protein [Chitinophagales bacterium]HQO31196.1 cupin domain-containing protein [Chitinophagales bacterium]
MMKAEELIRGLELAPHPEGGYYRRTYLAEDASFSSILFLMTAGNFSAFHRIASEEQWNWMGGDAIHIHEIDQEGEYREIILSDSIASPRYQHVVKGGHWFAATCEGSMGYALCGCTVVPAFRFEDFELADRAALCAQFPQHTAIIQHLTR